MTVPSQQNTSLTDFVVVLLDWLDERDVDPTHVDTAFTVLADHRSRLLLQVMHTYDEEITLADAAEGVASRETGKPIVDISADHVADVYISLYHDHLPRLVDAGLLEYDQERDLVTPSSL